MEENTLRSSALFEPITAFVLVANSTVATTIYNNRNGCCKIGKVSILKG